MQRSKSSTRTPTSRGPSTSSPPTSTTTSSPTARAVRRTTTPPPQLGSHRSHRTTIHRKEPEMALSDQLTKLAARAKEAEDRAVAAKTKARAELEQDVQSARETAQAQADQMRETAEANKGKVSDWWT